jgi:hypothetical protein
VITIVSGLPRSGTSLMMRMLAAGGMTLLTDSERAADSDNPGGYYEWEPAKLLPKQPELIDQAEGKAVKIISQLLLSLPEGRSCKVIFMERPFGEMLASQDEMLRRRGKAGSVSHDVVTRAFTKHLDEVRVWLGSRREISVYRLAYADVVNDPLGSSQAIENFLLLDLDVKAMAQQIDSSLYRNRLT